MPRNLSEEEEAIRADIAEARALKARTQAKKRAVILATDDQRLLEGLYEKLLSLKKSTEIPVAARPVETPSDVWKDQYNCWEHTPSKQLRRLLQLHAPVAFSDGNIKAGLCSVGMKEAPPKLLARYVELLTTIPTDLSLPKSERNMESVEAKVLAKADASRIRDILLPGDFSTTGKDGFWVIDDRRVHNDGVWCQ